MSKPTVTIDKITVTIGNRKLELTLAEARQLKQILDDTLEPKINYPAPIVIERHTPDPFPYRPQPMWASELVLDRPQITC